ncbi:MAG: hypothetical protein HY812_04160 [Planctomycetes bacterium]|nr:hypothetical protein [Planctomycetota bacterium]
MSFAFHAALAVLLAAVVTGPEPTRAAARLRELAASRLLVIAHRGDSAEFPENTLPAFRSAVDISSELVELDVRQAADGALFCCHDETLDRTTDAEEALGRAAVGAAALRFDELAKLDAGAWKHERFRGTRVPALEEALALICPRALALLDCKDVKAEDLVALLQRLDLGDRVVVQSFEADFLAEARRLGPELTLAAGGSGRMTVDHLADFERCRAEIVHWDHQDLRVEDLAVLKKKRILVFVYTVDHDIGMAGAAALGVDGVTTDDPNRLKGLLRLGQVRR